MFSPIHAAEGEEGLKAVAKGKVAIFSRLYWFTVEFGMALEDGALKLYGAGLASSFGEAAYALDSARPERLPFDLERVLRMPYRSDAIQPRYFVIDGPDTLRRGSTGERLEERLDACRLGAMPTSPSRRPLRPPRRRYPSPRCAPPVPPTARGDDGEASTHSTWRLPDSRPGPSRPQLLSPFANAQARARSASSGAGSRCSRVAH